MEPKFKMLFKFSLMETPSSTLWDSLSTRPILSSRQPLLMYTSLEQKCAKISNSMAIANMETSVHLLMENNKSCIKPMCQPNTKLRSVKSMLRMVIAHMA